MMNFKYICRVNSTLGSQSVCIETDQHDSVSSFETNTQSVTEVAPKQTLIVPIAAASAGIFLIVLGIIFILVCIISLR
jgi:hypothetical protein